MKIKRALQLYFLRNIQCANVVDKKGTLNHTVPRENQPLKINGM